MGFYTHRYPQPPFGVISVYIPYLSSIDTLYIDIYTYTYIPIYVYTSLYLCIYIQSCLCIYILTSMYYLLAALTPLQSISVVVIPAVRGHVCVVCHLPFHSLAELYAHFFGVCHNYESLKMCGVDLLMCDLCHALVGDSCDDHVASTRIRMMRRLWSAWINSGSILQLSLTSVAEDDYRQVGVQQSSLQE